MTVVGETACHRCREQKVSDKHALCTIRPRQLKCSREQPTCARCVRLEAVCTYPAPPDRKALAALRQLPKKRKTIHDVAEDLNESATSPSQQTEDFSTTTSPHVINAGPHLSKALHNLLQDTYFKSAFNANLLFHRHSFDTAFQNGQVPSSLLMAMYAVVSIFLIPSSPITRKHYSLLRSMNDIAATGRQWAITAGQEVLRNIDEPTIDAIRTCQILAIYWFSIGESQRNTMFSGIAYKAACTLGLDMTDSGVPTEALMSHTSSCGNSCWIEAEIRRRIFWAVWFTQSLNSDHRLQGVSNNENAMKLPLPMSDSGYHKAIEEPLYRLSDSPAMYSVLPVSVSNKSRSISAELMRLVCMWAKVRDHISAMPRASTGVWLTEAFELEGWLAAWVAQLAPSLSYSRRGLYEHVVILEQPVYVLVHLLYLQCRLVLHSSIVPRFSGLRPAQSVPGHAISMSAHISLQTAQKVSEIATDIQTLEVDATEIASFAGYCVYVSATIHITFLTSPDITLATLARTNLASNLRLIRSMKPYWSNLERLWVRLSILYASQRSRLQTPSIDDVVAPTISQAHLREFDKLAAQARDTSQLSEPFAESVLDFTLRNLKPSSTNDPNDPEQVMKAKYLEDLSRVADGAYFNDQPQVIASQTQMLDTLSSKQRDQPGLNSTYAPPPYPGGPGFLDTSANLSSLSGNELDWWQYDLSDLQEPTFSYDSIFRFDNNM